MASVPTQYRPGSFDLPMAYAAATNRHRFGVQNNYDAAQRTRLRRQRTGISVDGSGADYHYRNESDYLRMMELARDIDRNDEIVGQGLTTLIANLVSVGFRVRPNTGSDELNVELRRKWEQWSISADQVSIDGRFNFPQIERMVMRSQWVDGDVFLLPITDPDSDRAGTLEVIEAHRCRTPKNTGKNVVHGVLLDQLRTPLEYWFTKDEINPNQTVERVSDMVRRPAKDDDGNAAVFHVFDPKRFSQTRGITALAPIATTISNFGDIQLAKLVQQMVASAFAIVRELDAATESPNEPPAANATDPRTNEPIDLQDVAPGMQLKGERGEKIRLDSPNVPNPEYINHAMLILSVIAVNLDLPVHVLLLDAKQTNFSGFRGALDQARQKWRPRQRDYSTLLHRQVYEWKVREWLATDPFVGELAAAARAANALSNPLAHDWMYPGWPYIEPTKDVQADTDQRNNWLASGRTIAARRGEDYEPLMRDSADDIAFWYGEAMRVTKNLKAAFPELADDLDWREVAFPNRIAPVDEQAAPPPPPPPEAPDTTDTADTSDQGVPANAD